MAARYGLRSKQARLHASAADRSWQQAPGIQQVADFGVLPTALLQPILAQVPFNQKMKCEAVCRAWRKVLRCGACPDTTTSSSSAGGVWGHLDLYLDVHAERPDFSKASPFRIHSYGPYETNLCISEALDPDMSPEADFIEWLRLRAPAADKITIANTSAQEGWLFAALLLAVSGSGRLGVSTPPVSLRTGSYNQLTAVTRDAQVMRHRQWLRSRLPANHQEFCPENLFMACRVPQYAAVLQVLSAAGSFSHRMVCFRLCSRRVFATAWRSALKYPHQADEAYPERQCSSWESDRAEASETAVIIDFDELRSIHGKPFPSLQSHKHPGADLVAGHGNSSDCESELLHPADLLAL